MGHDGGRQGASTPGADWDADALQEWVAHVADAEEVTEGEILDRMLSALWILDEVESLMEVSEGPGIPGLDLDAAVRDSGLTGDDAPRDSSSIADDEAASSSDGASGTGGDEAASLPSAGWGASKAPDLDPDTLLATIEAVRGDDSATASRGRDAAKIARLDARLDAVVDDLGSLTTRVDRIHDRSSTPADSGTTSDSTSDLVATVDAVADRVDAHAETFDEHTAEIDAQSTMLDEHEDAIETQDEMLDSHAETLSAFGDTLCEHTERLAEVEASVEATDEVLDSHADRIETVASEQTEVASEQDELQHSYDANFENVDTALRFLVDRTDDVSETVEQLEASLAAERRERRRRADERRRLAELHHELASHGVTRASCESCRNDVDVSCLLRPRCPHCDRVFDGHRRRGGILGFFATDELTTSRSGPRMQTPAARGESTPAAREEPASANPTAHPATDD